MSEIVSNRSLLESTNASKFTYPHLTDPPAMQQIAAERHLREPDLARWLAKKRAAEKVEAEQIRRRNGQR